MSTHRISPSQLGPALRQAGTDARAAVGRGAVRAAHRGKLRLVVAAKEKGKVDLGQYINSFHVRKLADGTVVLYNDSPHAGIIELGARPHPVSLEGQEAIRGWVRRKLDVDDEKEVERITQAIVRKLERYGQKPTYVFKDELANLTRYLEEEVNRALKQIRGTPPGGAP